MVLLLNIITDRLNRQNQLSAVQLCVCLTSRPHKCFWFLFWGLEWLTLSECHEYIEFWELSRWSLLFILMLFLLLFLKIPFITLPYVSALLHCVIQALLSFCISLTPVYWLKCNFHLKSCRDCSNIHFPNTPPKTEAFSINHKIIYSHCHFESKQNASHLILVYN